MCNYCVCQARVGELPPHAGAVQECSNQRCCHSNHLHGYQHPDNTPGHLPLLGHTDMTHNTTSNSTQ